MENGEKVTNHEAVNTTLQSSLNVILLKNYPNAVKGCNSG